jgi:2-polyprenyl-3-methyl-5-hydroxy-6-metoxy-1,4-benzoquinol methylase
MPSAQWLDVGCGTGALSQTILQRMAPQMVKGIDRAAGYIEYACAQTQDQRVSFEVVDA